MEDNYIRGELLMKFCRAACLQRGDLQSRVLGVLTIDGWDQRKKEFRNLYQTQTIVDISWMSLRRNRQAGHRMTISRENV